MPPGGLRGLVGDIPRKWPLEMPRWATVTGVREGAGNWGLPRRPGPRQRGKRQVQCPQMCAEILAPPPLQNLGVTACWCSCRSGFSAWKSNQLDTEHALLNKSGLWNSWVFSLPLLHPRAFAIPLLSSWGAVPSIHFLAGSYVRSLSECHFLQKALWNWVGGPPGALNFPFQSCP